MENYTIDIALLIKLLEGDVNPINYYSNINLNSFHDARKNGKAITFNFISSKKYVLTYKSIYMLCKYHVLGVLSTDQLTFILESISMLEDEWIITDEILSEILHLLYKLT